MNQHFSANHAVVATALAVLATALVPSGAAAKPKTFALIVSNNRSLQLGRPDLRYADDDGAKFYELFSMVAPASQLALLTELDRDTERLFPELTEVATSPTKVAVLAAATTMARAMEAAKRAGDEVEFYFVFAGHGDVDEGRGFLELKDQPFYSEDLEALLARMPATHAHVVLDSCNSFFVVNARKPGGKRFATPDDIAKSLGKRMPSVGVFLSTSSEAEVFEWSELQSGIFSHAVRSGLAGAADANGDGAVSYDELRAFVDIAAAGVKNPLFRPHVYARGPGGNSEKPLFVPAGAEAAELKLAPETAIRLTVRDANDLPWIDVFKEAGTALSLRLPMPRLARASVDELALTEHGARVLGHYDLVDATVATTVSLSTLGLTAASYEARGPGELFQMLYSQPFGSKAFAQYQLDNAAQPTPVFGISQDDTERMGLLLDHVGAMEQRGRYLGSFGLAMIGGVGLGLGADMFRRADDDEGPMLPGQLTPTDKKVIGLSIGAVGAGITVVGMVGLMRRSAGERLHGRFRGGLASGEDPALVVARTEEELYALAREYRRTRKLLKWTGLGLMGVAGVHMMIDVFDADSGPEDFPGSLDVPLMLTAGVMTWVVSRYQYPIEQMATQWAKDPGIQKLPRFSVSPLAGGVMVGMQRDF